MIVFYTTNEDGTLSNISKDRISEQHVDVEPREFFIAMHRPHECSIVDGKLIVPSTRTERDEKVLREQYENTLIRLIRTKWSIDDELALINARDEDPEKYAAYRQQVAAFKATARKEVYGEE